MSTPTPTITILDAASVGSFTCDWVLIDVDPDSETAVQEDLDAFASCFTSENLLASDGVITAAINKLHGPGGGLPEVTFTGPMPLICAAFAAYMQVDFDPAEVNA